MTERTFKRYVRPLQGVRELMVARASTGKNPFAFVDARRIEEIFASLTSLDRDAWAEAFMRAGQDVEHRAQEEVEAGDEDAARQSWLEAYGFYRVARYPTTNSPKKQEAYRRYRNAFLQASRSFDRRVERVEIPLTGDGDQRHVVGYLSYPEVVQDAIGVVLMWGGIDTFKEDLPLRSDPYLRQGLATLAIDMPGVGEAPVTGADDTRPMWDAIFSWIDERADLNSDRVAALARSTGGYWATWVAHMYPERLRGSVNHGGPAHHAFAQTWIEHAQHGEYPLELAETLAAAWGMETLEDWVAYAPGVSLLTQGLLDRPCAPLLSINGINDSVFPIEDHYLLLQHGSPKCARFYPGGHMGWTPETEPAISDWIRSQMR